MEESACDRNAERPQNGLGSSALTFCLLKTVHPRYSRFQFSEIALRCWEALCLCEISNVRARSVEFNTNVIFSLAQCSGKVPHTTNPIELRSRTHEGSSSFPRSKSNDPYLLLRCRTESCIFKKGISPFDVVSRRTENTV